MRLLHCILYGFIYGFSELIPVSGRAHQQILQYIFGMDTNEPILDFLVHTGVLLAVIVGDFPAISRLRRDRRLYRRTPKSHSRDMRGIYEIRIVKTASVLMIIGLLLYTFLGKDETSLVMLAITSIFSGGILLITDHMPQGNKDSRSISALDAVSIGLGCALSAVPGISRVGMTLSISSARGAEKSYAYHWALLLSIPALIVYMGLDILFLFTVGPGTVSFLLVIYYLLSAAAAFAGGYAAISFMRYLTVRTGFSGIAYYNIGVALFTFILYLIT